MTEKVTSLFGSKASKLLAEHEAALKEKQKRLAEQERAARQCAARMQDQLDEIACQLDATARARSLFQLLVFRDRLPAMAPHIKGDTFIAEFVGAIANPGSSPFAHLFRMDWKRLEQMRAAAEIISAGELARRGGHEPPAPRGLARKIIEAGEKRRRDGQK